MADTIDNLYIIRKDDVVVYHGNNQDLAARALPRLPSAQFSATVVDLRATVPQVRMLQSPTRQTENGEDVVDGGSLKTFALDKSALRFPAGLTSVQRKDISLIVAELFGSKDPQ